MDAEKAVEQMIRDAASSAGGGREPGGWYSVEGDCLFYHEENVPYHAVRLGGLVTVYEALDDDRPVGLQIKGVRTRFQPDTSFRLDIAKFRRQGEDISLAYLVAFAFRLSRPEIPPDDEHLWRMVESASGWRVPADQLELVGA